MAASPQEAMAKMIASLEAKSGKSLAQWVALVEKSRKASGSFNSMVSHRVRIEKPGEVDQELVGWLKQAYESS
jgi:hypothetical protein